MTYSIFIYRNDLDKATTVEFKTLKSAKKQWDTFIAAWSGWTYSVLEKLEWSSELVKLDEQGDVTAEIADWSYWNHPNSPEVED